MSGRPIQHGMFGGMPMITERLKLLGKTIQQLTYPEMREFERLIKGHQPEDGDAVELPDALIEAAKIMNPEPSK